MVILTVKFGWKINLKRLLIWTSVAMVLCFVCIITLSSLNTETWQDYLLIVMLVANTLYSSINAVFQASYLGNIGRFPPKHIGSANDGMGLGTTLPTLVSIMILHEPRTTNSWHYLHYICHHDPLPDDTTTDENVSTSILQASCRNRQRIRIQTKYEGLHNCFESYKCLYLSHSHRLYAHPGRTPSGYCPGKTSFEQTYSMERQLLCTR